MRRVFVADLEETWKSGRASTRPAARLTRIPALLVGEFGLPLAIALALDEDDLGVVR
jgi:hypothetical protein